MTRFWEKVRVGAADECWEWIASKTPLGYGRFGVGGGRWSHAHRVAWELSSGTIPDGLLVCHRCDNPPCCNPAHLFLGTHVENMADCGAKGRHASGGTHGTKTHPERIARGPRHGSVTRPGSLPRGDSHPGARLRAWQIPYMRFLAESGVSQEDIGRAYGVSRSHAASVVRGKRWVWLHQDEEAGK
jgi:hypothetical protein